MSSQDYRKLVSNDGFEFIVESKVLPKGFPQDLKYSAKIVENIVQYLYYRSLNCHKLPSKLPSFTIEPIIALELLHAAI